MEPWTQPITAPTQPEIEGDPSVDAGVRVDRYRWMEAPAFTRPPARRHRVSAIDVLSAVVVISFLLAVVVALPLLLLGLVW